MVILMAMLMVVWWFIQCVRDLKKFIEEARTRQAFTGTKKKFRVTIPFEQWEEMFRCV